MSNRNYRIRWLSGAALAAALAAILFVALGTAFWHTDAPGSEATCSICHVAHMPVLPGSAAAVLVGPTTVAWLPTADARTALVSPSSLDSPPRAPPA
jgi:hypothetical protein